MTQQSSRRAFLRHASALSMAGVAAPWALNLAALSQASAATAADYKALVCVFMLGGNDGHNMLVPLAGPALAAYRAARGSLALPDGNTAVLPVTALDGTPYGLNGGLASLHPLWAQGRFAVLANTGMLVQPVTRPQFLSSAVPLPTNLFSHADQIQQMQSGIPSTSSGTGWGARAADVMQPSNGASTFPATVSIAGPALFCAGNIVQSASLLPGFNLDPSGLNLWPASAAAARLNGLQQVLEFDRASRSYNPPTKSAKTLWISMPYSRADPPPSRRLFPPRAWAINSSKSPRS